MALFLIVIHQNARLRQNIHTVKSKSGPLFSCLTNLLRASLNSLGFKDDILNRIRRKEHETVFSLVKSELDTIFGESISSRIDFAMLSYQLAEEADNHTMASSSNWKWLDIYTHFKKNHYNRLETAVFVDRKLYGLMIGKISDGKVVLKINFIQKFGSVLDTKGVKLFPILARIAELMALAKGIEYVGIQGPLPQLIEYYGKLGYAKNNFTNPKDDSLWKRLP